MPRTALVAPTQLAARSPSFQTGRERVARRLDDLLCPRLAPWGRREVLCSFARDVSQSPRGDACPEGLSDLGENHQYAHGLTNTAQVYISVLRRMLGLSLRGSKGGPWPLELEEDSMHAVDLDGRPNAYEVVVESDPDSPYTGKGAGHQPWRECFTVIRPEATPPGSRPPQANDGGPRPTPEQIAARWQELEDIRQGLDREEAELDEDVEPNARLRARVVGRRIEGDVGDLPLFERPSQ